MEPQSQHRKNRSTLISFVGLLVLFLILNFRMIAPYLLALIMGAILALISRPVYGWLLARKVGPKISAGLVTFSVTLIIVGPALAFSAVVVDQGVEVANKLTQYEGFSLPSINRRLSGFKPIRILVGSRAAVDTQIKQSIQSFGKTVSAWLLAAIALLPDLILQLLLALIACFFFLLDGRKLLSWLKDKLPLDPDVREHLYEAFKDTAISSIWATIAAAMVQSSLLLTAFLVLGVPGAFLAAGATFILAWIPLIGSAPVSIGAAIYLWIDASPTKAILMLAVGVLTGLSDNLVYPLVLKGKANLHPMVGLVAIFGGISMFGILGVFIGPVLAAILISLLQAWPIVRRRFGLAGEPAKTAPSK